MISILSKAATWSPEQPFGEAFSRVFSSRLCSAQLIWTAVRLDGGAFAARVREQLEGYRTALRSVRAGRLSQVPSGYSGDKSQMFLPLGKRGVAGHLWWVTVPDYQPQLPSPPSRSPSEYVWPLIFPFLGFSLPWLTVRSIAWISGGFLADRKRKAEDRAR